MVRTYRTSMIGWFVAVVFGWALCVLFIFLGPLMLVGVGFDVAHRGSGDGDGVSFFAALWAVLLSLPFTFVAVRMLRCVAHLLRARFVSRLGDDGVCRFRNLFGWRPLTAEQIAAIDVDSESGILTVRHTCGKILLAQPRDLDGFLATLKRLNPSIAIAGHRSRRVDPLAES